MDFKKVLEEWKNYQKYKLVMANLYPCTVTLGANWHLHGNLSFCGSGDQRRIKCHTPLGEDWSLLLSAILGTNPEGSTISFTLTQQRTVTISFSSEAAQVAVHEVLVRFEREEFMPTPPSSEGSGSGSSDD